MIVGVFHMSNPGHDMHNMQVDDVLAPKRQGEIAAVTEEYRRVAGFAISDLQRGVTLLNEPYPT